ncbi:ABC transporter permease [bacterium]|nr:ABC transporter permease [bacterium]MBU1637456.1 ABC transporter permease [bacterium]MBU1920800.1 ABC transporter permease [bacterium]
MRFFSDTAAGLRIAFRALVSNKLRAALTTLGIVIGVTTVILMITIILGLNRAVEGQFAFLGANTYYVSKWSWFERNWREQWMRPNMTPDMALRIKEESKLAMAATPLDDREMTVAFGAAQQTGVDVRGVSEDYLITNSVAIDFGRFLSAEDVRRNQPVAVIGAGIAERLFDKVQPIGQKISIAGWKFRVIGVAERVGSFFGQSMDYFVCIPYGTHMKRFGFDPRQNSTTIIVKAASAADMEDLKWELKGLMRRIRKLSPTEPDDFGINDQSLIMGAYNDLTSGIYTGGVIIAFISLLVGGIGIMNIMLVSVTERTAEIGLRKALGAKRWMVSWQFLVESAIICAMGGLVGVGFAWGVSLAINEFLPTYMPIWVVGIGIIFSAVVGVFFGLFPSIKAANMPPIEALRHE